MTKTIDPKNHVGRIGASVLGLLLLLIPIAIWAIWINTFQDNKNLSQAEKVEVFQSNLPSWIATNPMQLGLLACAASFILAMICIRNSRSGLKVINVTTLIASTLLLALHVFSMM